VAARRAADAAQSAERVKLSAKGWRAGLLPLAGHGQDQADQLRELIRETPHLFKNVLAYLHDTSMMIRHDHWWGPGTEAPHTPGADRRQAETEPARVGMNLFTALLVMIDDLAETQPSAFGPADDLRVYADARASIVEQAAIELASLRAAPVWVLVGHAHEQGVDLAPLGSLAQRLVEHELAGRSGPLRGAGGRRRLAPGPRLR
jgi:hypothetical protein